METFAYYPGCSLLGTAKEYDVSVRLICEQFGIGLKEVFDWNCCGASSGHSLNKRLAHSLVVRNFKLIQEMNLKAVVVPCAACFNRFKVVQYNLHQDEGLRKQIEQELGFSYEGDLKIYHLLDLLLERIGIEHIRQKVKFPLTGIKAACYYGCLLVRPSAKTNFDDKENPIFMDTLLEAIDMEVFDWPYKTECCGAAHSLSRADIVRDLVGRMGEWAKAKKVECLVTACPLCQANLEMRQSYKEQLPVFYFTELLALALGLKEIREVLKEHLITTNSIIEKAYGRA